ncbi:MAG TPA: site-specific integrase [Phycisphaerae bacterium]|nr:site-specific integrase [Phycisphaerae bacterium]
MIEKVGLYYDKSKKRWIVRWFGQYDPQTGQQARPGKLFRLKRDAEAFQAEKQAEFNQGGRRDLPQKTTLEAFCREWLEVHKTEHRLATRDLYAGAAWRLKDHFGPRRLLTSISARDAQKFLAEQQRRLKSKTDKPLSDWSRDQIRRCCKAMFETAVTWELIRENPFARIKGKRLTPGRWHRLRPQEYRALLDAVPDLRWQALYSVAYTVGLRTGELFNLTWEDIDFERGLVVVASRDGTKEMPPFAVKDHERREIPLTRHTMAILTAWQAQAPESVPYILLTAERYGRVRDRWRAMRAAGRTDRWRNAYMVNNVRRTFRSHLKRAGIKAVAKLSLHTFRKSCCQNWADHLPMNVTRELMGHANIATTAEFYSQVDEEHHRKAARIMDEILAESGAPQRAGVEQD